MFMNALPNRKLWLKELTLGHFFGKLEYLLELLFNHQLCFDEVQYYAGWCIVLMVSGITCALLLDKTLHLHIAFLPQGILFNK